MKNLVPIVFLSLFLLSEFVFAEDWGAPVFPMAIGAIGVAIVWSFIVLGTFHLLGKRVSKTVFLLSPLTTIFIIWLAAMTATRASKGGTGWELFAGLGVGPFVHYLAFADRHKKTKG